MAELGKLVPGAPLIPDQPQTVIHRQVVEWQDRADLAEQTLLDGKWRVLTTYPQFGLNMMLRYVMIGDLLEAQHAVVPIGLMPNDPQAQARSRIKDQHGFSGFVAWIKHRRDRGEAISLEETIFEFLCKAMPAGR